MIILEAKTCMRAISTLPSLRPDALVTTRLAFCLPYRVFQVSDVWRVGLPLDKFAGNTPQSPPNGLEHVRDIQARQGPMARIARGLLNTVQTVLRVSQAA